MKQLKLKLGMKQKSWMPCWIKKKQTNKGKNKNKMANGEIQNSLGQKKKKYNIGN